MAARHVIGGLVLCVVLAVVPAVEWHAPPPAVSPAAQPAAAPTALLLRGRLEPAEGVLSLGAFSVAPTVSLGELLVAEGTRVAAGDVVATLANRARALAEVAAARAALGVAQRRLDLVRRPYRDATLDALRNAVAARRAEVELAEQQMRRTLDLQRAGVRADAERDTRQSELRRAAAALGEAEAHLAAATGVAATEIGVAEAEVALAEARLAAAEAEAALTQIRAPRAGTILQLHVRSGEPLAGRPILDMADLDRLKAIAEVDERLLPGIALGLPARVAPRGATRDWPATVSRIGGIVRLADRAPAEAATGRGVRFVEVDLDIADPADLPRVAGLELIIRLGER